MKAFSTAAALAVLATATAVTAQTQEQPFPAADSASCQHKRETMTDTARSTTFAATAAQDGMTEVALAGVALQKSHNVQVRQLAQQVVQDYAQSNGELDAIVQCEGLILPTGVDAEHDALVKRFYAKSGSNFDTAYLKHIMTRHSEAVALFESASKSGDPYMATFARKGLSTLQQHHLLADNVTPAAARK